MGNNLPMQRMLATESGLVEEPPSSEETGFVTRRAGDPLKPSRKTYQFNLASDGLVEPWLEQEANRYP